MQGSQALLGVVFFIEKTGGCIELFGVLLLVNGDFPDRGEALFFAFCGDGDGVPWPLALVFLPEPPLAVDQVDLLKVEHELVLMDRYKQVVGLGGAPDQSAVSDLLDAVVPGAGDGVHFTAKIEVDSMLRHGFPKVRVASLDGQHAG